MASGNESEEFYSPYFDETYDIIPILLGILIMASNSLVLYLYYYKRSLRTVSNTILSSLSISDGLTGLCGIPLYLVCSGTFHDGVCISSAMFTRFTSVSTVLHLTVVMIDRLTGVMKPLEYYTIMRKTRAYAMITSSWLISIFSSLVHLFWVGPSTRVTSDGDQETIRKENIYSIVCLVAFFILPLLLMLFSYTVIFLEVLRQRRKIERVNMPSCRKTNRQKKLASEWKPALLFMAMTIIFMLTWLPYFFLNIEHNLGVLDLPLWAEYIFIYMRFLTSFTNPLLYVFGKQDFREAMSKSQRPHLFGKRSRSTSTDVTLHLPKNCLARDELKSIN